jgi:hypothetical protein
MDLTEMGLILEQEIVSWIYGLLQETIMANGASLNYYPILLIPKIMRALQFSLHQEMKFILPDVLE